MNKLYNKVLENIILPFGDKIFGTTFIKNVKYYRVLFKKDEKALKEFQVDQLNQILNYSISNSNFYKLLEIQSIQNNPEVWLKKFPIMDKITLRSNIKSILTLPIDKLIKNSTSGSSGIQTIVYVTKKEQSQYRAIQTIWWEWAGFSIGEPMLQTGLAETRSLQKRLKDLFFRTYYLFAFGLTKINTIGALDWLKGKKPFLGGYASSLYVLSQIAETEDDVKCKSAISWGDKLFDHYKKKIENVFKCKVYETYGASEGLMIASQKDLDYMYIMSPCVYLEIVDDNGNEVQDGEMGHVLITSLIHKAMPLIRYKLGDLAIKLPINKYPEIRELKFPLLQKVIGRETDIVKTPNGGELIVHSFTGIFEYYSGIQQFCVIQNDLNGVIIEYIKGDDFEESILIEIEKKLLNLIDEEFEIKFRNVLNIPSTKSGKPQLIVSNLQSS
jgi:phenylacetate-CoA ligase